MHRLLFIFLPLLILAGCAGPSYVYHFVPGKTATMEGSQAVAPPEAPPRVQAAIAAGNAIAGAPYRYGGGHRGNADGGFDCSGAASYVLREAGLIADCMPSKGFRRYGERGEGEWISVYARRNHVFLVVAGLRFDTGWTEEREGPRWTMRGRPANGAVIRHPRGL